MGREHLGPAFDTGLPSRVSSQVATVPKILRFRRDNVRLSFDTEAMPTVHDRPTAIAQVAARFGSPHGACVSDSEFSRDTFELRHVGG